MPTVSVTFPHCYYPRCAYGCRARSEPGGTRWRTGGEVKGKLANGVGSQYSHATSECGLSRITQADAHTSTASSRLNWRSNRFKWTRSFRGKTKSGFCAYAITFSTSYSYSCVDKVSFVVVRKSSASGSRNFRVGNGPWSHLTRSWELAGHNLTISPIRADSTTSYNGKDFIRLGFPGTLPVFMSLKELCPSVP